MERLELTDVRSRVAKGQQVDGGERFGVTLVEVQSVNHGTAFEHDSHTRMAVAVDAAFVAFTDGRFRLRAHGTMIARARCIELRSMRLAISRTHRSRVELFRLAVPRVRVAYCGINATSEATCVV